MGSLIFLHIKFLPLTFATMINAQVDSLFKQSPETGKLRKAIALPSLSHTQKDQKVSNRIYISGLVGSALSFAIAQSFKTANRPFLLVFNDKEEAAYHLNDLETILGSKKVLFYPASYKRAYDPASGIDETDNANVLLRSEVLNRIGNRKKPVVIISYSDALFEKVVSKKELQKNTLKIAVGDRLSVDFVNEVLFEYHFNRTDFVTEPGEFSLRGGILDVFSFSHDQPYRIEFFGDEIESIRTFDVESQLSVNQVKKIAIIPNLDKSVGVSNVEHTQRQHFLEYITDDTVVFIKNRNLLINSLQSLFAKAKEVYSKISDGVKQLEPEILYTSGNDFDNLLPPFTTVDFYKTADSYPTEINFQTRPQPSFNKQFDLLIQNLNENTAGGYKNYIFCATEQQAQRFHDIFEDAEADVEAFETVIFPIHQGFIDDTQKICCYTDHQIFERYHKFHLKNGYTKKQAITLKELTNLEIGDYVTHIDHGIGKFGGLQKIDVEGKKQEAIKLIYGERDILYLSIHSLHKIAKYNGKDGKPPKIYKLGSGAWKALKQKTKTRVKQIAFDLIQLYAKRKMEKGFAFAPDSYLQHELESSFIYEDTPDQITATADVKRDMESDLPMDRLVCGDVGFGKTEVAIRAAFKAVDNSKQVAVLVPTTILAFQHFKTFSERLKGLPVNVDYLNRFRSNKDKTTILKKLENGQLDIIIGTHQLVNKALKFKDLGLLIIDEEQKFGVAVKDKLKLIKENVDTLTLTATPIPRTLQFSLMAARDLSVITTPPPNRYPIETQVIRFSEEIIRDAISYEISRGGQVFFIHNRIENIQEVAGMLQRLVPDAKIAVGHGQMDGKKLEDLMLGFMNGHFDVLVSTSIVENGLDVPNANTIFINNANFFGLSDLHQMRGRVGRSNKKAFCYFITPEFSAITEDARKRITALEQFSDLGSGFQIAMKDLEIRGAGDLLGGEQSGFINEIGFETYQKILAEAIEELKENDFKELYLEENTKKKFVKETVIDTDFELLFPDNYVNSITERYNLYTRLGEIGNEDDLQQYETDLKDRFGELPTPAKDLLDSVRIKWIAGQMGLERIVMKQNKFVGYFIADQNSSFYLSPAFQKILEFVQHTAGVQLKEKETKNGLRLLLSIDKMNNIPEIINVLRPFRELKV